MICGYSKPPQGPSSWGGFFAEISWHQSLNLVMLPRPNEILTLILQLTERKLNIQTADLSKGIRLNVCISGWRENCSGLLRRVFLFWGDWTNHCSRHFEDSRQKAAKTNRLISPFTGHGFSPLVEWTSLSWIFCFNSVDEVEIWKPQN